MKNMLDAVENEHKGCLHEKNMLNSTIIGLQQKLFVLETDNEETDEKCQKLKNELKQINIDK